MSVTMLVRAVAFTVLCLGVVWAQSDPILTCLPKEDDSNLCKNVLELCQDMGYSFYFGPPDAYCEGGYTKYFDPDVVCNCNILCIKQLEEGDECKVVYTSKYPKEMCGTGLDCMADEQGFNYICGKNRNKPCVKETLEYEEGFEAGTLGPAQLLPSCNDVGEYDTRQCSTSTSCYCSDKEGNRLFGEAAYTEAEEMNCECALHWTRNEELQLTEGFRCLPNGNLDTLQCNHDFCFCYNSTLDQITQGPYPHTVITEMDCYIDGYHSKDYENPCTIKEKQFLAENPQGEDTGLSIGNSQRPSCARDGFYSPIQLKDQDYICVDRYGAQIEDFAFSAQDLPVATCHCATRRSVMMTASLSSFLPDCCPNGSYQGLQTRGIYAFCVNENGNQAGDAVSLTEAHTLNCPACS